MSIQLYLKCDRYTAVDSTALTHIQLIGPPKDSLDQIYEQPGLMF